MRRPIQPFWMVALAAVLGLGCSEGRETEATRQQPLTPMAVEVVRALSLEHTPVTRVAGILQPDQRAQLGTRQAGTVESVWVRAGDRVEADQPILRVDARDLEAARTAAERARNSARTTWDRAEQNHQRFRRLHEQDLVARARMEEAEVEAAAARGRLAQAEAELAAAEINLDYATLRAPFAGVVSELIAELGSFVAPGPPLAVFEDRTRLKVDAGIDQSSATRIQPGQRLPIRIAGLDEPVEATVQAVLPALEDTAVGLRLRLVIETPPPTLTPGMVAEVAVPTTRAARTRVLVPETALLRRGQLEGVFVVRTDDEGQLRARLRWLRLGDTVSADALFPQAVSVPHVPVDRDPAGSESAPPGASTESTRARGPLPADWVEVRRGLEGGEWVVVGEPVAVLTDNQPVTLNASGPKSDAEPD